MQLSPEEFNEFKIEALELLDQAEKSLLNFENKDAFTDNKNIIFRAFHSLKGSAGMLELVTLQNYMHILENKLTHINSVEMVNQAEIDYFLKGVDGAKTILSGGEAVPLVETGIVQTLSPSIMVHADSLTNSFASITNELPEPISHSNTLSVDIELLETALKLLTIQYSNQALPIHSFDLKTKLEALIHNLAERIQTLKRAS